MIQKIGKIVKISIIKNLRPEYSPLLVPVIFSVETFSKCRARKNFYCFFKLFQKKNFSKNAKFCKILENFGKLPIFEPDFHPEDDK